VLKAMCAIAEGDSPATVADKVRSSLLEAGIGKSRLLFEFRDGLAGNAVTYVEGQCRSYGSAVPYLPVLDVLKAMCAIAEGDSLGAGVGRTDPLGVGVWAGWPSSVGRKA